MKPADCGRSAHHAVRRGMVVALATTAVRTRLSPSPARVLAACSAPGSPRLASIAATLTLSVSQTAHAQATWTGGTDQDWNNAANWSTSPSNPTGNFTINTEVGNYPVLSANSAFTPVDLILGDGAGQSGRLDHTSGTLSLADIAGVEWHPSACSSARSLSAKGDRAITRGRPETSGNAPITIVESFVTIRMVARREP